MAEAICRVVWRRAQADSLKATLTRNNLPFFWKSLQEPPKKAGLFRVKVKPSVLKPEVSGFAGDRRPATDVLGALRALPSPLL